MGRITRPFQTEMRPALTLTPAERCSLANIGDDAAHHPVVLNDPLTTPTSDLNRHAAERVSELLRFHGGDQRRAAIAALQDGYRAAEIDAALADIEQRNDVIFRAELAAVRLAMAIGGGMP